MQISIEKTEGLERNLTVSIPAEDINSKVSEKLKKLGTQVKIKGFRPGKIPKNILVQRYGKHARQEVLGDLMNSTIQKAIKDNKLSVAEAPEVIEIKNLDDGGCSFIAKLEIMPEIPEIDYSKVVVKTEVSEVSDTDVDEMIKKLQKQKQEWKDSKAKIANGDLVTIEYSCTQDNKTIYPLSGTEKMGIVLGESGVPDELVDAIIDMKVKESKTLEISFPKVFNVAEMADKKLDFAFSIVDHKKGKLPAVDEDFIKSFGIDSGDKKDLVVEIKRNLGRELANTIQVKTKDAVLVALRKEIKGLQISDKMLARETAALAHQAMERARQNGIENPPHPQHKEFEGLARERIMNSLIINNIATSQNIQVDYTKVREKVMEIAQTFENPQEIAEYYYGNKELLGTIENAVLESQVIDWLSSKIDLQKKKVAFNKLMDTTAT
ncbi:Cell division trigger factor [hydrothermal vent metagenome]|uniref:peptidylprolyl isomerase n=1 Tax=hydrothermal vent metagenome TaxID=652676 RepID=A0A3B0V8D7_9ZZZZ